MQLVAAIYGVARAGLSGLPDREREDTYAVSFFVYDQDDDPRSPTLTVGTNTLSRVESAVNQADDEDEARWNYAFWLQNRLGTFPGDQNQRDLLDRWLRVSGLRFEEHANPDEWASLSPPITTRFVEICVKVAQLLHSEGDIAGLFGTAIPVVVHELEYYDQIADQILQANHPGVADKFAAWVRSF